MKPNEVLDMAKQAGAVMVDLRFIDLPGVWQHTSAPIHRLDEGSFEDGFGFDGSSIRGYQPINASDMLVIPDPGSAQMDPFTARPTLALICSVVDPITRQPYSRDPRYVARKAEAYLAQTGLADTCHMGPEAEFFVFDDVRYAQSNHEGYFHIDSVEGEWNTGRAEGPNLGYKLRHKEGYFPVPPSDTLMDLRTEMVERLHGVGIQVEVSHHEVASAGQNEIDMKYAPLVSMADKLMWFKYVVKNVARRAGKTATFMPKPIFGDNGSGMHVHQSLWKGGKPLFAGDGYAQMSEMALWYAGGVLKHARALAALTNPTTNSYRRLLPGFEAPVNLAYSSRNRSAAVRIPMYDTSPKSKRLEVRFPDPSCNPYLAFAAMMMAGIDGILERIDPGDPLDKDIYALSSEELSHVPHMPGSLEEALGCLEADHEFLLRGDVFTRDVLDMWIEYKRDRELNPVRLRPVPYEFFLYYDI
jgi:glutamine synthetase